MTLLFNEATPAGELYRQVIDNALDAFIGIGPDSRIIEWSKQAEATFGWSKDEVAGKLLTEVIIPERHARAHLHGIGRFIAEGVRPLVRRRVELPARRKDGNEIDVELSVTPIDTSAGLMFFASIRDISKRRKLEEELHRQASVNALILENMAGAVLMADVDARLIAVNPAGQKLLNLSPVELEPDQKVTSIALYRPDGLTLYPVEERPTMRALRGEHVDGQIAMVRHAGCPDGAWVSVNARPLRNSQGELAGAVSLYSDITELRRREESILYQARRLQEQAGLLDLALDAILTRTADDIITYWNRSAEIMYGFSREEAIGRHVHRLLKTRFPAPLSDIMEQMREKHYWEGELVQSTRDGRQIIVFSKWAVDFDKERAYRYLETNTDITERVKTERALRQTQEDVRMLVESATDYAIMTFDVEGAIMSWNPGAERIFGLQAEEALGRPSSSLFTTEDCNMGEPARELEEVKTTGRSEDERWHVRKDGSRFWATGVVTALRHADGSLRGYAKIMRDRTRQRLVEEQTRFLANHDALTGLSNRVNFSNHLHAAIAMSQRKNAPFALLLLDLDKFKHVNDTFGHHVGDLLLKEVGLRLLSSIRETDFVARLGGDEFVVIQADVSQPDAAEILARKIVLEIGRPYQLDAQEVVSGTSIGICLYPSGASNPVDLLKRADLALYRAKAAGRQNYQFYTPELSSEQIWKRDRETALQGALKNHQFELYYQPQIDLQNWRIAGVEALLRWNAADLETVLPDDFLPFIEKSGLIVEIGEWALREAAHQVRRWQAKGMSELRLSVNCSARQFGDAKFVASIPAILKDAGVAFGSLELEVPESLLARHPEIKEQLSGLRAQGIRITIDNFGTGAIALMDLKDFEIDVLKIDKAFVQHVPHRREDSAITSAIINLAHNLGIAVVAGGVETAEQLAYLKARDCSGAQGFIFSPPVPAGKLEELMLNGTWSHLNGAPHLSESLASKGLH